MRVHKIEKIEKLKALRQKGYSINELARELGIPKTTVWHHIQKIEVLPEYKKLLKSKRGGSKKLKESRLVEAKKISDKLLIGKNRELVVIFAMLYWAEGTKKAFQFINSDGRMINLYLYILRNVIGITDNQITPIMRIYTGMDKNLCLEYWSRVTRFSKSKFIIRINDGGASGRAKYGMCRIEVKKSGNLLKLVLSLINQICHEHGIVS